MAKIPKVGEKVQVRLQTGKEVVGVVRIVLTSNSGPRLKIEYGYKLEATVNPDQVVWQADRL